jgi:II/X family phage/plasmid replication protein
MYAMCGHLMIDTMKLQLPIKAEYLSFITNRSGDYTGAEVCPKVLHQHGFKLAAGEVEITPTGTNLHGLHCPYQSLPSSNSSLGYKLFKGGSNYFPFIELNASGAKLLQGHNVFGSNCVETSAMALLEAFFFEMPSVRDLDITETQVSQIDVTFSAHVDSYHISKQVIDALKHISTGQVKKTNAFETSSMWNAGSKNIVRLAYLKEVELTRQLEELKKQLKVSNSDYLQRQYFALTHPLVKAMAKNSIRFEAKIKKLGLKKRGLPTLLRDLIHHDKTTHNLIETLWLDAWQPIFATFEGDNSVNIYDDLEVENALKKHYQTITKNGISFTKAMRIFTFFRALKAYGFDNVKSKMPKSSFYDSLEKLTDVVPKSYVMNLTADNKSNVVPLIKLINVDFAKQLPHGYQEPLPLRKQLLRIA